MKPEDPLPAGKYTYILNYEPFVQLFKKLTKKSNILSELDVQTVQFIFKYANNPNPLPFFYQAYTVQKILTPLLKQIQKYFPQDEVSQILKSECFYTSEEMEDLIQTILKRIKIDYPNQTILWRIIKSENPKQKGFKILANKCFICSPPKNL